MRKALICLEQLGIGGVETFTVTQVEEFARRGIKCFVMAKDGPLSKRFKDNKLIEFIEFDFELKNEIDFEKVKKIEKVIKKHRIDFMYVHQFPCIQYVLPCAFRLHIPYVAYLHNGIPGTIDWYSNYVSIYRSLFPIYFNNASKIIAISDKVKKENQELFHLPDDKYMVVKNSISFSEYPDIDIKLPKKYKNISWIGRTSKEKKGSIIGAVEFYRWVKENYNPQAKLTIVGDGNLLDEIKETYKDEDIIFRGAVADIKPEIKKADIILGMGRCVIEGMASKKPSIICGYNEHVCLISPRTIDKCMNENFAGHTLEDNKREVFDYTNEEMEKIIEDNYQYIKEKLSISNSIFLDIEEFPNKFDFEYFLEDMNRNAKDWDRLQELNYLIKEENVFITDEVGRLVDTKKWKFLDIIANIGLKINRIKGRKIRWIIQKNQDKH